MVFVDVGIVLFTDFFPSFNLEVKKADFKSKHKKTRRGTELSRHDSRVQPS